jgi:hypothetical protein
VPMDRGRLETGMEIFGIVLSIPVAFIASTLYCLFVAKVVSKSRGASRWLSFGSYLVLFLFLIEVALLATLGAVRSRTLIGAGFYVGHLVIFFLGVPALANLLVLRIRRRFLSEWYVAAVLCTVFAFSLVMLQYGVSEELYGIDGVDGPFSSEVSHEISHFA